MNPSSVGNLDDSTTWPKSSSDNVASNDDKNSEKGEGIKDDENWEHLGEGKGEDLSCNELIHQPFLLNNELPIVWISFSPLVKSKEYLKFSKYLESFADNKFVSFSSSCAANILLLVISIIIA